MPLYWSRSYYRCVNSLKHFKFVMSFSALSHCYIYIVMQKLSKKSFCFIAFSLILFTSTFGKFYSQDRKRIWYFTVYCNIWANQGKHYKRPLRKNDSTGHMLLQQKTTRQGDNKSIQQTQATTFYISRNAPIARSHTEVISLYLLQHIKNYP